MNRPANCGVQFYRGKIDDMIILFLCLAGGFNLKTLLAGRALWRGGRLRG